MLPIRTNSQQGKTELLSFWSVRSWVSQKVVDFNVRDIKLFKYIFPKQCYKIPITACFEKHWENIWCSSWTRSVCIKCIRWLSLNILTSYTMYLLYWACSISICNISSQYQIISRMGLCYIRFQGLHFHRKLHLHSIYLPCCLISCHSFITWSLDKVAKTCQPVGANFSSLVAPMLEEWVLVTLVHPENNTNATYN